MIFSTFQYTLYQDSYTEPNTIGHSNTNGYNYVWRHTTDWQKMSDDFSTDGYKSVEYVWVQNNSGSTHDILIKGEWRYIVNGGAVVV